MEHVIELLEEELKKLKRNREHSLNQLETFEDLAHNQRLKYEENNEKIEQLKQIIEQIKNPTL